MLVASQHFNLIDEPWIPVVDSGRVSLRQFFSESHYQSLGGTPIYKIALFKLLLAIAQSAYTPDDETDWAHLGPNRLSQHCLDYLERWYERFWLYGERPFLQMPAIELAKIQPLAAVLPEVASGNTSILTDIQQGYSLNDADKALLIVLLMGFPLGGKKTDNQVILSSDYYGKTKQDKNGQVKRDNKGYLKTTSGRPGPNIGTRGYLHNFLGAETLLDSLWLNLFTHQQVQGLPAFTYGIGVAPWERMPASENCPTAQALSKSLMGRLVPLSRFCLLTEGGLHYSEGIAHPDYKSGQIDASIAVDFNKKTPKALWVNPEQRPWRYLTSLLSFMTGQQTAHFDCLRIRLFLDRFRQHTAHFYVWSGGLKISNNAGEQYASGNDDYVESAVWLDSDALGELWFNNLQTEMKQLERLAKILYKSVTAYYDHQKANGSVMAQNAKQLYWQYCEQLFQDLLRVCGEQTGVMPLHKRFASCVYQAYEAYCPRYTARQMDLWARCLPNLNFYFDQRGSS